MGFLLAGAEFLCRRIPGWRAAAPGALLHVAQLRTSEWMASGRAPGASARCPITATRRAAEAARAHRPAGCSSGPAWPVASARAAAPPRERPAAGGREPEGGRSTGWLCAGRRCSRLDSARQYCLSQRTLAGRTQKVWLRSAHGKHAGLARL